MQSEPVYAPKKDSKLPLIVILGLLLIASLAFGIWAFGQMQDYKNNVDAKISTAVAAAKKQQEADLRKQFDETAKSPYKAFRGPATYGSVTFAYPKSWSVYVDSSDNQPLSAYFYPDQVPSKDSKTAYPLRVQVVDTDYAQVIQQYTSQLDQGDLRASAFLPPKMKNIQPGTRFDGNISQSDGGDQNGSLVVMKVRDKTLEISTQTTNGIKDFNDIILASLTFSP